MRVFAKVGVAISVTVMIAGCEKVSSAGYGYVGRIAPVQGRLARLPQAVITDPTALSAHLRAIDANAPPAQSDQARIVRERAIWDARQDKAPFGAAYMMTLQCGEAGRYLTYHFNTGEAQVALVDLNLIDKTKAAVVADEEAFVRSKVHEMVALSSGGSFRADDLSDVTLDQFVDEADILQLPNETTVSLVFSPVFNFMASSELRRAQASAWFAYLESKIVNGGRPSGDLVAKDIMSDMAQWRKLPMADPIQGQMVARVPLRGGIADVCVVAEFSDVDIKDESPVASKAASLRASLDAWYLVRRNDGTVLAETPTSLRSSPSPSKRP